MSNDTQRFSEETALSDQWSDPAELAVITLRAHLAEAIRCKLLQMSDLSDVQAADLLCTSPARVADLITGDFNKFNLDMLARFAERLGLRCSIIVT